MFRARPRFDYSDASVRRIGIVLVLAALLIVDGVIVPLDSNALLVAGPLAWVVAFALAYFITVPDARAWAPAGILITFGWPMAVVVALMYASCDPNMDSSIWQLVAFLIPFGTVHTAFGLLGAFAMSAVAALLAYAVSRASRSIATWLTVVAVVGLPVVFAVTTMVLYAHGVHPRAGNCVI